MRKTLAIFFSFFNLIGFADECCEEPYVHRFIANFYLYAHHERNYNYTFPLLGVGYSLEKYDGIELQIAINAGFKSNSSFIYDYILLGYNIPTCNDIIFCPMISFENTDHFFKNHSRRDITFIRNRFLFGLKLEKIVGNSVKFSLAPQLFKDFEACAHFFKDNSNFWGKRFHYPFGIKANGLLEYFASSRVDVVLGAFYLETFNNAYKEFGGNIGLAWNF
jgi:hypothetical protein